MPESWTDGLAYEVMGTPLWAVVALAATFVATYTGYRILMRILESRWLLALAENQPELYKSMIGLVRNPLRLLQLTIAAGIGLHYFALPEAVARTDPRAGTEERSAWPCPPPADSSGRRRR